MLHLSRGQQQKVAVARAFLSSPRLMLLDEPTTGLDPRSKREVQGFVAEVRRESQVTILLTTHDMDEAEQLCDRIGFLSGGRLVAEGTPLELRKQVAAGRPLDEVDMEAVFIELTGRSIEEDEDEDQPSGRRRIAVTTVELCCGAGHRAGWAWGGPFSSARPTSGSGTGRGRSCGSCTAWSTRSRLPSSPTKPPQRDGEQGPAVRLTMFLLIGTLVWAYMSAVLDDMSLTIMWERWEGTIEHTLMAPVPRVVHLVGMSAFGILHALIRTSLIMACALPFFHVDLARRGLGDGGRRGGRREHQPGRPRDPGRYPAAPVPRAGRTDVVHGAGPRPARLGRLLQRDVLPGLVAGCLPRVAGDVPAPRHPRRPLEREQRRQPGWHVIAILAVFGAVLVPASLARFRGRRALGQKDRPAEEPGIARLRALSRFGEGGANYHFCTRYATSCLIRARACRRTTGV